MAAALSLMAFAVASAQAEVGSHWNVNGSSISKELVEKGVVPAATLEGSHGVLLSHAIGIELNILCTSVEFEEARLKLEGSSLGKIKFAGCQITTQKKEGKPGEQEVLTACEPHTGTSEEGKGVVLTNLLKDLIILHEGAEGYDRLEPEEGTRFVVIATSAACAFGENIPVIGKFVFKDCSSKNEKGECITEGRVEKEVHLTVEGPLTELWTISKTEEHKATIDGSANVFLTLEHKGLKWSGTPA